MQEDFSIISWCVHKQTTSGQWNVFILANYLSGNGRPPPSKVNNSQQCKKNGGKLKKNNFWIDFKQSDDYSDGAKGNKTQTSSANLKETYIWTNKQNKMCFSWSLQHDSIRKTSLRVAIAAALPLKIRDGNRIGDNYTLIDHEKQVVHSAARISCSCTAWCHPIMQNHSANECCLCNVWNVCWQWWTMVVTPGQVGGVAVECLTSNNVNLGPRVLITHILSCSLKPLTVKQTTTHFFVDYIRFLLNQWFLYHLLFQFGLYFLIFLQQQLRCEKCAESRH